MNDRWQVLLLSGSTRTGSTNTAVLRTAAALLGAEHATLYDELSDLPAFNPDHDPPPAAVRRLRAWIHRSDAVLICTPEYAGALPGSFKNLLDWTVGDDDPRSLYGKPVAWINASSPASPTGGADAHASFATVLGYIGADIVGTACRRIPLTRADVGVDGLVADPALRSEIDAALRALRSAGQRP